MIILYSESEPLPGDGFLLIFNRSYLVSFSYIYN